MQRLFYLPQVPEAQERCSPFHPCMQKVACLRYRAVPVPGVPLGDHSAPADPTKASSECAQFLPLPDAERAP
jgi:hypothetical protein